MVTETPRTGASQLPRGDQPRTDAESAYQARLCEAVLARTRTVYQPVGPIAYDCVKVIVVLDGSAILFSEFGQKLVTVGDVILLCANTLCESEPEGHITGSPCRGTPHC